jgi:hypothetical protein
MSAERYKTGEQIHAGDRVAYNLHYGCVVFVVEQGDIADGWDQADYRAGLMIEFDHGARLLLEASDGLLEFVQPGLP